MGTKETTHVVKIGADIDSLLREAKEAKNVLSNLLTMDKPPKEMVAAFKKIDKILDSLTSKKDTFRGTDAEFKGIISELRAFGKEITAIERIASEIDGMSPETLAKKFLGADDYKKFKQAAKAVETYKKALESIDSGDSSTLSAAKAHRDNVSGKLELAERRKSEREAAKTAAESTDGAKAILEALKGTKQKAQEIAAEKGELRALKDKEAASRATLRALNAEQTDLRSRVSKEQEASYNEELAEA